MDSEKMNIDEGNEIKKDKKDEKKEEKKEERLEINKRKTSKSYCWFIR